LNEEPGIRLFWTTLWLIATSGIHRVLDKTLDRILEQWKAWFAQPWWPQSCFNIFITWSKCTKLW